MKPFLTVAGPIAAPIISLRAVAKKKFGFSTPSGSPHSVDEHVCKDETYVQCHLATNQNQTQRDNLSSKVIMNPYTGKSGSKESQH